MERIIKYIVYRHTSPSGKVYIGITCNSPNRRWGRGSGYRRSKFYTAIKKYGWDNFKHEILFENLSKLDAEMIEMDLVYYYKKIGISYNLADGGNVGSLGCIRSEETRRKIGEKSAQRKGVLSPLYGRKSSEETKRKISEAQKRDDVRLRKIQRQSKPILQLDKRTGVVLRIWESGMVASRTLNINQRHISSCCLGKRPSAGGYKWMFYNKNV